MKRLVLLMITGLLFGLGATATFAQVGSDLNNEPACHYGRGVDPRCY